MNWPYLHTLINHFPIVLSSVGTAAVVLALITGRRGVWLFALATLTLAGVAIYPAYLTGDNAWHTLRGVWYIERADVQEHDAAASFALLAMFAIGALSGYAWWRMLKREVLALPPRWLRVSVVLLAIFSFTVIARTSYLGGEIIHGSPKLVDSKGPPR